jgi:flagellin-like hook-associated protein FlgL
MASIYPLPTTRSSESLVQARLLSQLTTDQLDLLRLQTQISTGRRVIAPSDDAPAAIRGMGLQRLLEQKAQSKTNIGTSQSYLSATDVSISTLSNLINNVRGTALSVVDSTASDVERKAASTEIDRALQQILDIANQQFRGRYLFAGSDTSQIPYAANGSYIQFNGNEQLLQSYADMDLLFESNVPGSKLFGGLSAERKGTADLNPVMTADTKLRALNGGLGIRKGSISVSDGISTRVIDISSAETIGDIAGLIERNPPAGRRISARVTATGLTIGIDSAGGGNLTIREVGSGTTAAELGIVSPLGVGIGQIVGRDLNPRLALTTKLTDMLGVRASAIWTSTGLDNDILIQAKEQGAAFNGFKFQLVDDELLTAAPGLSATAEVATFSAAPSSASASVTWSDGPSGQNDVIITAAQPGTQFNNVNIVLAKQTGLGATNAFATYADNGTTRTLTITIDDAANTSIATIKTAVQAVTVGGQPAFTVADDNSASGGDGTGSVLFTTPTGSIGNTGNSGGDANTVKVRVQKDYSTAKNVVDAINANAQITALFDVSTDLKDATSTNAAGTGPITIGAPLTTAGGSGAMFDKDSGMQITNGGRTVNVSFHDATTLEDVLNTLNGSTANVFAQINADGTGIDVRSRLSGSDFRIGENGGQTATQLGLRTFTAETRLTDLNFGVGVHEADGLDFTIRRNDGVELKIDIATAKTIGDVMNMINNHPDNLDPNTKVVAQLTATGNGIELIDDNPQGVDQLTITRAFNSEAAWDLGLIPRGKDVAKGADGPPPAPAKSTIRFATPAELNTGLVLTAAQVGTHLNNVQVVFQNVSASGNQALVNFDASTKVLTIDVDPTSTTANTVIAALNAEGTFTADLERTLDPTNNGNGLITQTGTLSVTSGGSANPVALSATASLALPVPNNVNTALTFTAVYPGTAYNDATIEFIYDQVGDVATASYNPGTRRLQIHIDATATTANTVRDVVNQQGNFLVEIDHTTDLTNDGTGIIAATGVVATLTGGTPETLVGTDPYTIEASGIFNSLIRLQAALESNDQLAISRAAGALEDDSQTVNFVRADLGAKAQGLDSLDIRIDDETIELKTTLSKEIEVDLVEAISNLTARQATFQASLQLIGKTFQLSLLDFI